jgi:hypothetical protein
VLNLTIKFNAIHIGVCDVGGGGGLHHRWHGSVVGSIVVPIVGGGVIGCGVVDGVVVCVTLFADGDFLF